MELPANVIEKFFKSFDVDKVTGCWIWKKASPIEKKEISRKEILNKYQISRPTMNRILRKAAWRHI